MKMCLQCIYVQLSYPFYIEFRFTSAHQQTEDMEITILEEFKKLK